MEAIEVIDWAGQTIGVGDTILYTTAQGRGLQFGDVLGIDTKQYNRYSYPKGGHVLVARRVKVKSRWTGNTTTIIEELHPIAFESMTKFSPPEVGV